MIHNIISKAVFHRNRGKFDVIYSIRNNYLKDVATSNDNRLIGRLIGNPTTIVHMAVSRFCDSVATKNMQFIFKTLK